MKSAKTITILKIPFCCVFVLVVQKVLQNLSLTQNKMSVLEGLLLICPLEKKQIKECTKHSVAF